MIPIDYLGEKYYYCITTDSYYDIFFKRLGIVLSNKLEKATKKNVSSLDAPTLTGSELISTYLRNEKGEVISKEELALIADNKKSRHETIGGYLRRIISRFNLKWRLFSLDLNCAKINKKLKEFFDREKINYKIVSGKVTLIKMDLPLFMIDYETALERIDEAALGTLL